MGGQQFPFSHGLQTKEDSMRMERETHNYLHYRGAGALGTLLSLSLLVQSGREPEMGQSGQRPHISRPLSAGQCWADRDL